MADQPVEQQEVREGQEAPDFTLRTHANEVVTLSDFRGKKTVVLATFALAFTSG